MFLNFLQFVCINNQIDILAPNKVLALKQGYYEKIVADGQDHVLEYRLQNFH